MARNGASRHVTQEHYSLGWQPFEPPSRRRCSMKKMMAGISLPAMLFMAGCCNPGNIGSQAVTLDAQQTSMWCWAASGKMTMDFVHSASNVQECDEANKRFGRTDCCHSPVPS